MLQLAALQQPRPHTQPEGCGYSLAGTSLRVPSLHGFLELMVEAIPGTRRLAPPRFGCGLAALRASTSVFSVISVVRFLGAGELHREFANLAEIEFARGQVR